MGSFISEQIIKHVNPKIAAVGVIEEFNLENDGANLVLRLHGEAEALRVALDGISWESTGGLMRLHYERVTASRPWIQGIFALLAERCGGRFFEFKDKLGLYPLRMVFRKHGGDGD